MFLQLLPYLMYVWVLSCCWIYTTWSWLCVCLFSPAEKPATEPHTQPSRLSASSSSSDSSSSSSSSSSSDTSDSDSGWGAEGFPKKGSCEGPLMFRFPPSGLNCCRATDDGAAGRIRRDQHQAELVWLNKCQTKKERDGAFPALGSFIRSRPGHGKVGDGWMDGKEETLCKVLPFSGALALSGRARDAPSPAKKKKKRRRATHVLEG